MSLYIFHIINTGARNGAPAILPTLEVGGSPQSLVHDSTPPAVVVSGGTTRAQEAGALTTTVTALAC